MLRKRKLVLALIVFPIVGLLCFLAQSEVPTYRGKSLAYWERRFPDGESEDALVALSSNSIPFLVKALQRKESRLARAYKRALKKLPPSVAK